MASDRALLSVGYYLGRTFECLSLDICQYSIASCEGQGIGFVAATGNEKNHKWGCGQIFFLPSITLSATGS